jgi:hypothetical protein
MLSQIRARSALLWRKLDALKFVIKVAMPGTFTKMSDALRLLQLENEQARSRAVATYNGIIATMTERKTSTIRLDYQVTSALEDVFKENGFKVRRGSDRGGSGPCECNYAESCGNHDSPFTIINVDSGGPYGEERAGK